MSITAAGRFRHTDNARRAGLALLVGLVAVTSVWAMTIGTTSIPPAQILDALFGYDASRDHVVVIFVRLPRVLAGLLVGASLAVAGAIMQAVTNNPLASPDLLGINAGAAFAVVMSIVLFGIEASAVHAWYAFGGAAVAAASVYAAGSIGPGGPTPLKLLLAGAVLTAFLTALTTAILIFDQGTLDQIRLWAAGSLAGRPLSSAVGIAPYTLCGLAAALVFRRQLMTLSLGPDVARSVGQDTLLWQAVATVTVVLLAGSAVALGGPIGFVGLVAPHVARLVVGGDYRWIIPYSAAGGALLVVCADAFARNSLPGQNLPVGVTMTLLGAPFFIYLARYRMRRS
jgi:iron complex transport system permease protein